VFNKCSKKKKMPFSFFYLIILAGRAELTPSSTLFLDGGCSTAIYGTAINTTLVISLVGFGSTSQRSYEVNYIRSELD